MNNPQHIEALTDSQVVLLRTWGNPRKDFVAGKPLLDLRLLWLEEETLDEPTWEVSPAGRTLIATLDTAIATAVQAERERVLAEIDAVVDSVLPGVHRRGYQVVAAKRDNRWGFSFSSRHTSSDCDTFTEALFAAANSQEQEGR